MTVEVIPALLARAGDLLAPLLPKSGATGAGADVDVAGLLRAAGWRPEGLAGLDLNALAKDLRDLGGQLQPLLDNPPDDLAEGAVALAQLALPLAEVVDAVSSWTPPTTLPPDIGETLVADLGQALIDGYLWRRSTLLHAALRVLGVLKLEHGAAIELGGKSVRDAQLRPRVDLEPLQRLFTKPGEVLQEFLDGVRQEVGAGDVADAVADAVGPLLAELLRDLGFDTTYGAPGIAPGSGLTQGEIDAAGRLLFFDWLMPTVDEAGRPLSTRYRLAFGVAETSRGLGFVAACSGAAAVGFATPHVRVDATATGIPQALILDRDGVFLPDGSVPTQRPEVRVEVRSPGTSEVPLALRLGKADGTRLEIGEIVVAVVFDSEEPVDVSASLTLTDVRIAVSGGDGDGFLAKVLPAADVGAELDLQVDWSLRRGLRIRGGAQLEARLPLHVSLGPLHLVALRLGIGADETGLEGRAAVDLRVELGPVKAVVERFGVGVALVPAEDGAGALGPVAPRPRLLLPLGVGLALGGAAVTGGGYLYADHDAGRYAGVLQVGVADVVTVTAIGLLATRMPDGSEGFSLLVILTAEFPPVQLGLGFVLTGLGGLVGLHRTMDVEALRAGVRTGGLDSVLFPRDPVENAPRVIRDLEAFFPVAEGRFTVGLMAALGWGSPVLVKLELGVILEIPAPVRVVLLGRLTAALPTPEVAVVLLQVDILGVLDLEARHLSIDATLRDSRIAAFTLTGDLAVRMNFGAAPALAVSCGGFNPRFTTPQGFPALRRLAIALATGENPRLRLEAYLATTPTSVQLGARLDVYAEADLGALGIFSAQAFLGFDALVYLVPRLSFIVDLAGGAAISRNGNPLLSAELLLTLEGPEPVRYSGYASFTCLGTHRIPIEGSIGAEPPPVTPVPGDPVADVLDALAQPGSWRSVPPPTVPDLVGIREPPEVTGTLLLHPFGSLAVAQRVAPLDTPMERYTGAPIDATLTLTVSLGGTATSGTSTREPFPAGEVFELTEDEKLTGEAFPLLPAGFTGLRPPNVTVQAPPAVDGDDSYETAVLSARTRQPEPDPVPVAAFGEPVLTALLATAATGRAPTRSQGAAGYTGASLGVAIQSPTYRIAQADTLAAESAVEYATSYEAGRAAGPGTRVVRAHELQEALGAPLSALVARHRHRRAGRHTRGNRDSEPGHAHGAARRQRHGRHRTPGPAVRPGRGGSAGPPPGDSDLPRGRHARRRTQPVRGDRAGHPRAALAVHPRRRHRSPAAALARARRGPRRRGAAHDGTHATAAGAGRHRRDPGAARPGTVLGLGARAAQRKRIGRRDPARRRSEPHPGPPAVPAAPRGRHRVRRRARARVPPRGAGRARTRRRPRNAAAGVGAGHDLRRAAGLLQLAVLHGT